ncbi:DUF4346 domain-containing protein [Streptomyces fulvorobeus]|uniref:Acyl carrier protein n=1 Tax=Streptomyces fulvorobeus TaxID=284028 RepID=A0A7J0CEE5_9ACTN|nr:hypothetical protein [Streptomyces fulvorobeus]NYE44110.1 acyl carrier protein [Streptomyces fulvorobeus]GFN00618.1 hypothetical protein Sfulv_54280 [Streptomyces fulvorobeus]
MVNGPGGVEVAVCSLSSRELVEPLSRLPGVALAGTLMTANLGIEELVRTLARRPAIRGLVVCGRDSPRFLAGQSLLALFRNGVDPELRRIVGAAGHLPLLRSVPLHEVERLRSRLEVVDARGEGDPLALGEIVRQLWGRIRAAPPPAPSGRASADGAHGPELGFRRLRAGGRRVGLSQVLEGFVVISLDRRARRIVLRHYDNVLTPRHEMTGVRAESMLLGLLQAGVITDASHAGYLGGELTKAETALRLGLPYVQDIPLRAPGRPGDVMSPAHEREENPAVTDESTGLPSMTEFVTAVVTGLGLEDTDLAPDVPLGTQVSVESVRMIELAILLEEELGLDLPPDLDLRTCSPQELYGILTA